jgi:transposase-like protein
LARPAKYTPERERLVLEAIRGGATRKAAALHAGIDEQTFYNWMRRYSSFSGLIARAEADVEVRCVALILNAATTDPRHAEWWLERRRPESYGHYLTQVDQQVLAPVSVTIAFDRADQDSTLSLPAAD